MATKWQKLNFLIPGPQCRTKGDLIFDWIDVRPQPTQIELDAVTDQEVIDSELDTEAGNQVEASNFNRLLFEIHFDAENRVRALEGKSLVTKLQYKTAVKNIYKGL